MLRLRDVYPGSRIRFFSIPDANCFHPGSELFPSRIHIKEFQYFIPKKWFLSSRKYDPGCSSRIPDSDPDFLPIPDPGAKKAPDPGSRGQKGTGSRFRFRNTGKKSSNFRSVPVVFQKSKKHSSSVAGPDPGPSIIKQK